MDVSGLNRAAFSPQSPNDFKMHRLYAKYQIRPNALIKGGQLALLSHGQGKQISIGHLSVSKQPLPINLPRCQQTDISRPENVLGRKAGRSQPLSYQGRRPGRGVARL